MEESQIILPASCPTAIVQFFKKHTGTVLALGCECLCFWLCCRYGVIDYDAVHDSSQLFSSVPSQMRWYIAKVLKCVQMGIQKMQIKQFCLLIFG